MYGKHNKFDGNMQRRYRVDQKSGYSRISRKECILEQNVLDKSCKN